MGIAPAPSFSFQSKIVSQNRYIVMKIKAKNPNAIANCRLIVPFDGLIAIDGEGCVEVSAPCAQALVNGTSDWEYVEEDEKETQPAAADDGEESSEEENEPTEREKFEKELSGMTVAQMKELCREGGFPEEEWKNLKKAVLVEYLLSKFDAATEEEEEEESEEETASDATTVTSPDPEESEEKELEEEEEEPEEESEEEN